jgi:hypothetical protein
LKSINDLALPNMNSRRAFLVSLPALTFGAVSARAGNALDCDDSAKTIQEIKKRLLFPAEWTEGEFDGRKLLFALAELPSDSASFIDLHGWIYNEHFKEWRRFLMVSTRHLGRVRLLLDTRNGVVSVRGAANNDLNGAEVLRFDLRATSNDAAYKK